MSCGCQPSTSGKFPLREPGRSHFGYSLNIPGFLWDIWPLGITMAFWPCLPTAQDSPPSQVCLFCEFTWAYFASDQKN